MQKRVITTLLVLSIVLLLANMVIGFFEGTDKEAEAIKNDVRTASIDSVFFKALDGFGLDSNWVVKKHISGKNYDSLKYVYNVKLPVDVPITMVLQDLSQKFDDYKVELVSEEKVINRNSILDIFSNGVRKLQARFSVDKEAVREHANFAFIINDFNDLNENEQAQILQSRYELGILFVPSKEYLTLIPEIIKNNKRYCLEINDDISDENYELEKAMSKKMLQESIKKMLRDFSDTDLMIVDDNSEIYQSAAFSFISDQFADESIELGKESALVKLPGEKHEAESMFEFYIKSGINKKGRILSLPGRTFLSLAEELHKAGKIGTKFYFPGDLEKINAGIPLE